MQNAKMQMEVGTDITFCYIFMIIIGFGGNIGHDSHMTSTHYAILVLSQFSSLHLINKEAVVNFIAQLQNKDVGTKINRYFLLKMRKLICCRVHSRVIDTEKLIPDLAIVQ
jgi:prenyltransferase beta subunit